MFRKYNAGLRTRQNSSKIIRWTFSMCLKSAWNQAKELVKSAAGAAKTGLRRMHYSKHENNYSDCETVPRSYDKRTKTIEVLTLKRKIRNSAVISRLNSLCPRCHTYCYGDCMAH